MEARGLPVDLVEEEVALGGLLLRLLRPPDAEALLDERAFEHEELLPYWAELWPSSLELAEVVARRTLAGASVLELGCGLAVPSLVAALGGARVLATDWSPDAVRVAAVNAKRNGVAVEAEVCSWTEAGRLVERGPWDLVLASDVLYERRDVESLLGLLPCLVDRGEVLLADPGRPHAASFLSAAEREWRIEPLAERVFRLTRAP